MPLTGFAALASVALLGVELAFVGSLCLLCEAVHVVAFALLAVTWQGRATLTARTRDDATLVFLPPLGIMLGLLLVVPKYWGAFGWKGDLPFPEGVTEDGGHWIGARDPKLTLDEYTDYLCPHCRIATELTLRKLAARPNAIRVVRRQFPLARCVADRKGSCLQVRMANCASEQQRFWQMDRWLFAHADELRPSPTTAARDLGIDPTRFASCVESEASYARAERESKVVSKRRLQGTPTYMVGDKRITLEKATQYLDQGHSD